MLSGQLSRKRTAAAVMLVAVVAVASFYALKASGLWERIDGDRTPGALSVGIAPITDDPPPAPQVAGAPPSVPPAAAPAATTPTAAPASTTSAPASAAPAATAGRAPGVAKAVGQMIVSGVSGLSADTALRRRVRAGHVGGVILMGYNISTPTQVSQLIGSLQAAARAGGNPPLLIVTDQEGGTVKRFASVGPSSSAAAMGASASPRSVARREGIATGQGLRARGVNVDLAPVADVASAGANFLGSRAFGSTAASVARAACGFASGLQESGIGATLKHFPGLGRAAGTNTDEAAVSIGASRLELQRDWQPYRACAGAPRTLVMMSSAAYPDLTGQRPAVLAPSAYAALRNIGFRGPTITDSLGAGALRSYADLPQKAARAGANLLLFIEPAAARRAYAGLLRAVDRTQVRRGVVMNAAALVRDFKQSLPTP